MYKEELSTLRTATKVTVPVINGYIVYLANIWTILWTRQAEQMRYIRWRS
jgi:hypothetical protein